LTKLDQPVAQAHTKNVMDTFNLNEAETDLSSLVERAAGGEEIIIAKAGRPMARLVPLAKASAPLAGQKRDVPFGLLKGQIWISPDFDAADKEIEESFDCLKE
jgi:prevent-host-death family protein